MSGISILLTYSYGHTVSSVRNILVEQVAVVLHVVYQEVGRCSHHKRVTVHRVIQPARRQTVHLLVDVEDADLMVSLAAQLYNQIK